ncbi:hypothetical protein [Hymenobacter pini]|nr:hypothetical protein [Hymenobacter pini]MCA8833166.1 hypothetical protein [Hymenobacter pini]
MKVTLSTLAEVLAAQRRAAKPAKSRKKTAESPAAAIMGSSPIETPAATS